MPRENPQWLDTVRAPQDRRPVIAGCREVVACSIHGYIPDRSTETPPPRTSSVRDRSQLEKFGSERTPQWAYTQCRNVTASLQ